MKRFLGILIALMVFSGAFAQQIPSINFHNTSITYNINDLVTVDGIIYKATVSNTNDVPPSANWEEVSPDLSNYVTLDGTETITGTKTFTAFNDFGDNGFDNASYIGGYSIYAAEIVAAERADLGYDSDFSAISIDMPNEAGAPSIRRLSLFANAANPYFEFNTPSAYPIRLGGSSDWLLARSVAELDAANDSTLVNKQWVNTKFTGETAIGRYDEGNGDTFYPVGMDRTFTGIGGAGALDLGFYDGTGSLSPTQGSLGTQSFSMGYNNKNEGYGAFMLGQDSDIPTSGTYAINIGTDNSIGGYSGVGLGTFLTNTTNYGIQIGHSMDFTSGGLNVGIGYGLSETTALSDKVAIFGQGNKEPIDSEGFNANNIGMIIGSGDLTGTGSTKFVRVTPRNSMVFFRDALAGLVNLEASTLANLKVWDDTYPHAAATVEYVQDAVGEGAIGGSITVGQIAIGDATANDIIGSGSLTFNAGTLSVLGAVDVLAQVEAGSFIKDAATSDDILLGDGSTTSLSALAGGGVTNLSYTASPTNGIVTSDTGTDATITLADGTNAGLMNPTYFTNLANTSGTNTGDNAVNSLYSGLVSNVTTNLGYTASPTNGVVTSSDGTDATLTLADGTNAGLMNPTYFTNLANTSGTNTGDQDLSAYALDNVTSTAGGAAYTTNSTENGNHIVMTGATPVVTLDDASVSVGNQFHIYNKSGEDMTWAFGTGDGAYQGSLPTLADGLYAWATLESANTWSVIVGGSGGGGGSSTLSGLTDTNITTPANGEVLQYNSSSGQWENSSVGGTGDMLKTTYDTDTDDIVDNAEAVGGVAITNIARTDVAETFSSTISATNLSGTNTGDNAVNSLYSGLVSNATHTGDVTGATALTIATDAVDIPMLSATGTADATTFLRGDNTWAVPSGGGGGDVFLANNQTFTGINKFDGDIWTQKNVRFYTDGTSGIQFHRWADLPSQGATYGFMNMDADDDIILTAFNRLELRPGNNVGTGTKNVVQVTGRISNSVDPSTDDDIGNDGYNKRRFDTAYEYTHDSEDVNWALGTGWTNGTDVKTASSATGTARLTYFTHPSIAYIYKTRINVTVTSGSLQVKVGNQTETRTINATGIYEYASTSTAQDDRLELIPVGSFTGTINAVYGLASLTYDEAALDGVQNPLTADLDMAGFSFTDDNLDMNVTALSGDASALNLDYTDGVYGNVGVTIDNAISGEFAYTDTDMIFESGDGLSITANKNGTEAASIHFQTANSGSQSIITLDTGNNGEVNGRFRGRYSYIKENITTSTYSTTDDDAGKFFVCNSASAQTITINSGLGFRQEGHTMTFFQRGTGELTIAAGSGVTLYSSNGLKANAQYSVVKLIQIDGNEYVIYGDTKP